MKLVNQHSLFYFNWYFFLYKTGITNDKVSFLNKVKVKVNNKMGWSLVDVPQVFGQTSQLDAEWGWGPGSRRSLHQDSQFWRLPGTDQLQPRLLTQLLATVPGISGCHQAASCHLSEEDILAPHRLRVLLLPGLDGLGVWHLLHGGRGNTRTCNINIR